MGEIWVEAAVRAVTNRAIAPRVGDLANSELAVLTQSGTGDGGDRASVGKSQAESSDGIFPDEEGNTEDG